MALEFNKRYTWKEIAEAYPDMYAIYSTTDLERNQIGDIISCVLLDICSYEERNEIYEKAPIRYGNNIWLRRTTSRRFPTPMGVLFW